MDNDMNYELTNDGMTYGIMDDGMTHGHTDGGMTYGRRYDVWTNNGITYRLTAI